MRIFPCLWLLACGDPAPDRPTERVSVTFESPAPTVATIRWGGGPAHVRYDDRASPTGDGTVQLIGLAADETYAAELVYDDGGTEPFTITVPEVRGRPAFTIANHDPARSQVDDGYVLMALVKPTTAWALMIDGEGRTSWSVEIPPEDIVIDVRTGLDGASLLYAQLERTRTIDRARIHRVALDGTSLSSTRMSWGHHMFRELSDGTIGWMGHDFRDVEWDGATWSVFTDTILEAPEGAPDEATTAEVYNFFDDYVDFYLPCEHVGFAETRFGRTDLHEWTHANSLMLPEDERSWFVAPRLHDAIVKVDRATGATEWILGGAHNEFTPITDDEATFWWSHGHLSQLWDGGFVMFDNGSHDVPPVSSVAEYRYDEVARTIEKVWEHREPLGRFVPFLGDVRKLPGGNYLVAWSSLGTITEVTPEGDVVWSATAEPNAIMGRVLWIADPYHPVGE